MRTVTIAVLAAFAAACASVRWSGGGPASHAAASSRLAPPRPQRAAPAPLPDPTELKKETALFPSDLGPDELPLADYPLQQRYNYRIYAQACSRCHSLARSLWAPHTSGAWLDFYLTSMRIRGRIEGRPLSKAEVAAVRDFLAYDARERKSGPGYAAQREGLEKSFDALMDARMEKLQKGGRP